jgi:hypothetical protein
MKMVAVLLCWLAAFSAKANIFASDIRLNGSLQVGILLPSNTVTISYVLNDAATAGVWVRILSRTNVIKTFSSTNGSAGTNAGLNAVVWDGSTGTSSNMADGVYTVAITAASAGYSDWTQITDDGTNFLVTVPRGVAVNQNTNSPYYGRVFVANANTPFGIFKFNADGSPAEEGNFSSGGLSWGQATHYSPWKIAISGDDKVYVDDFSGDGVVYAFDETISMNSIEEALRVDNYPTNDTSPQLSGLAVTGSGTNTQIWMADNNMTNSAGIIVWNTTNGLAATNDAGTIVAPVDPSYSLSQGPFDIDVDTNGAIYAIQFINLTDPPGDTLMAFPPFQGTSETNTSWAIGNGDPTLMEADGVAVDPTATCVAVAVVGTGDPEGGQTGYLNLYNAASGNFITNLDAVNNISSTGGHAYYDVAWDRVGNLYALDWTAEVWRVYSPPGANQSTTVAVPFIQTYHNLTPPVLGEPAMRGSCLHFTLWGQSNVSYAIEQSTDLQNWTPIATNFSKLNVRHVCAPASGDAVFFKAMTLP